MGTAHIGKAQHDTALESVGALEDGSTSFDLVQYFALVPSGELETAIWLQSDRMGFLVPALTAENLRLAQQEVLNELRERVDSNPQGRVTNRVFELAFPSPHPYFGVVIGRAADVRGASVAALANFFEGYYMPENAVIVLVGDVTPIAARRLLEKYFGGLPARKPASVPLSVVRGTEGPVHEEMNGDVAEKHMTLAWRVPPAFAGSGEDDRSLDILAILLGDSRFGLIPRAMIHAQELLSAAKCTYTRNRLGSVFRCELTVRDGVTSARVEAAFDRVLVELVRTPSSRDIAAARVAWRAQWLRQQEDMLERARTLAWYVVQTGDAKGASTDAIGHDHVTPEMVGRVVSTRLLGEKRYVVVVNPRTRQ
jgi:zinc protease